MSRTITAMFDDRMQAHAAVNSLMQELNVPKDAVQMYAAEEMAEPGGSATGEDTGFWASLKDLFVPDEDRTTYAEGVRRGSIVVSTNVDDANLDYAMSILEDNGAIDLDSREAEWRQSGWTGSQTAAVDGSVASSTSETGIGILATATTGGAASSPPRDAKPSVDPLDAGEEVIPVVGESLRVGKRDIERSRVKVRSYIVETPVSEQVTLRNETVNVERRVVDRPLTDSDDAFRERTIEAVETDEEVVVAKEARITGEVVVRKESAERTEIIEDTVRHTGVEIDDTVGAQADVKPGTVKPPGAASTTAAGSAASTEVDGMKAVNKG